MRSIRLSVQVFPVAGVLGPIAHVAWKGGSAPICTYKFRAHCPCTTKGPVQGCVLSTLRGGLSRARAMADLRPMERRARKRVPPPQIDSVLVEDTWPLIRCDYTGLAHFLGSLSFVIGHCISCNQQSRAKACRGSRETESWKFRSNFVRRRNCDVSGLFSIVRLGSGADGVSTKAGPWCTSVASEAEQSSRVKAVKELQTGAVQGGLLLPRVT